MRILRHESLRARNTLALESYASAYASVERDTALREALAWAEAEQLPVMALGQGSNVVLAGDVAALVIQWAQCGITLLEEDEESVVLAVAAGENWHSLVCWSLAQGYYGLENLALIPGSVGAAPIQNIGAYGVELAPLIRCVSGVGIADRRDVVLSREECEFGYRDSIFKGTLRDQIFITSIEIMLSKKPRLQLAYPALRNYLDQHSAGELSPQAVFNAVVELRQSRLPNPAREPNAGSFFKNPVLSAQRAAQLQTDAPDMPQYPQSDGRVKLPAAWLIDQCGWKGKRVGDVGVHPRHALVLVNYGGGQGDHLLALAGQIQASVLRVYGVELEIEPRVYGGE